MNKIFPISGAVCFADADFDGETIHLKPMNPEYRFGMVKDGVKWASKDGKLFVIALSVKQELS